MSLFGFGLFEITPVGLWCIVSTALACWFAGKLLFKDDRHLKDLQREANDCAQELAKWGFTLLPPILTDFAVLDFITLKSDFRHAVNVMKDPQKRRAELAQLLANMVKEELTDTQTRQAFFDSVYNQAKAAGLKPTTP
ncbi:MAG TPA: hypothetical protein VG826_31115 [Pirellulales bacterium]|nr:hypothetical protein [Pirellulales bacterium]